MAPRIEALRPGVTAGSAIVSGASATAQEVDTPDVPDLQQGEMAEYPLFSAAPVLEAAPDHPHWDIVHKDEDAELAGDGEVLPDCDLGDQIVADCDAAPAIAETAESTGGMSATDPDDDCERALVSDASCSELAEMDPLEIQNVGHLSTGEDVDADAQDNEIAPETANLDTDTVAVATASTEVDDDQHALDCAANAEENDLDSEESVLEFAPPVHPAADDEDNAELPDDPAVMLDGPARRIDRATDEHPATLPDVAVESDLTNSEIQISADMGSDAFDNAGAQDESAAATAEEPVTIGQLPGDDNGAADGAADDEPLMTSDPQDEAAAGGPAAPAGSNSGKAPAESGTRKQRRSRSTTIATGLTLVGAACVATVTGILLVKPELMIDSLKHMIG